MQIILVIDFQGDFIRRNSYIFNRNQMSYGISHSPLLMFAKILVVDFEGISQT